MIVKSFIKNFIRTTKFQNKLTTWYSKEVMTNVVENNIEKTKEELEEEEELMDLVKFQDEKLEEDISDLSNEKFIKNELIYNEEYDFDNKKILKRPPKKILWGLGGELVKRKSNFFKNKNKLKIEEIKKFLELELLENIYITNFYENGKTDTTEWGFICSGFTNKHIYKSAKNLVNAWISIDFKCNNRVRIHGRKDDEWIMVNAGQWASIHFMTKEAREDMCLEDKWNFRIDEETIEYLDRVDKFCKNRLLEPFKFK